METVLLRRHKWLAIVLATILGLALLYLAVGVFVVPRVVERELPAFSERRFGVRAQLQEVTFNPFLLRLTARDLRVDMPGGEALARAQSVLVDLKWAALLRRAALLDALRLDGLDVSIVRAPDGRIDIARLGGTRTRPDAAPAQLRLPRLSIDAAAVRNGAVHFIDRAMQPEVRSDVTAVDLELLALSTQTDRDGRLRLTALLPEGGSLAWTARVALDPPASEGDVQLRGVRPLTVWKHMQRQVALAAPGGHLDFSAHYRAAYEQGNVSLALQDIELVGTALTLREAGQDAPALKIAHIAVRDARFDLSTKEAVLPSVILQTGLMRVATDEAGIMNWQRMFQAGAQREPTGASTAWQVQMPSVTLQDMGFEYTDRSRVRPVRIASQSMNGSGALRMAIGGAAGFSARSLRLDASHFVIAPLDPGADPALMATALEVRDAMIDTAAHRVELPGTQLRNGQLRFAVDRSGRMNWASLFAAARGVRDTRRPDAASWSIRFPALRATGLDTQYRDDSRLRPLAVRLAGVEGGLDLAIAAGAPGPVSLDRLHLAGKALSAGAAGAGMPLLSAQGLALASGSMQGHDVDLRGLHVHDGAMRLERDARGATNWSALLQARPERNAESGAANAAQPWRIRLPGARVERMALHYLDGAKEVPLAVDVAAVGIGADLQSDARGLRLDRLRANASDVKAGARGKGAKLLVLSSAAVTDGRMKSGRLDLGAIELTGGRLQFVRQSDGLLDAQALFTDRAAAPSKPMRSAPAASALQIHCSTVRLRDFALRATDRTRAVPLRVEADAIAVQSALDVVAGAGIRLRDLMLHAGPLRMQQDDGTPVTGLAAVALTGGELDTGTHLAGVRELRMEGGALQIERDAQGRFALSHSLAPAAAPSSAGHPVRQPGASAPAWRYRVERASLERFAAHYVDHAYTPALAVDLPVRKAQLTHLDPAAPEPARFTVDVGVGKGGTAQLTGTLAQDAQSAQGQLKLADIDLTALQPVLGRRLALQLESGVLAGASELRFRHGSDGGSSLHSRGRFEVRDFSIKETATGQPFLAWKTLIAHPVIYSSNPSHVGIGEIFVQAPEAKLEIAERGGLNLKHILKPAAAEQAQAGQAPPQQGGPKLSHAKLVETTEPKSPQAQPQPSGEGASPKPAGEPAPPPQPEFVVRVDRLRVRDGRLHYADDSLVLPFDVMIEALNGTMISVSNVPGEHASMRVEGRIDPFAYARAGGSIDLFSPRRFTDIRARFANVEMPKLSPYTITFAGRAIAAGKLWLDLNYKIVDSQLLGNNSVTVHNLKLGERVQAPRARDLPLDLAARLLTNEEGVISVDVPLRGDLNKPGFDYHGIIRKAIANTLERLATSPFRFIGRLLGLAAEKIDRIAFEPGSDVLRPPQQEKLHDLAQSLEPGMRIDVEPTYAGEQDVQAMQRDGVRRELARRLGLQLAPREDPGPTAYDQVATQRALEDMLQARSGEGAPDAFAARFGKSVARVRRDGAAIGPGSPDTAFYEALFRQLVALQPLAPDALHVLARQRADAIVTYLERNVRIDPKRITTRQPASTRFTENEGVQSDLRLRKGSRS